MTGIGRRVRCDGWQPSASAPIPCPPHQAPSDSSHPQTSLWGNSPVWAALPAPAQKGSFPWCFLGPTNHPRHSLPVLLKSAKGPMQVPRQPPWEGQVPGRGRVSKPLQAEPVTLPKYRGPFF